MGSKLVSWEVRDQDVKLPHGTVPTTAEFILYARMIVETKETNLTQSVTEVSLRLHYRVASACKKGQGYERYLGPTPLKVTTWVKVTCKNPFFSRYNKKAKAGQSGF